MTTKSPSVSVIMPARNAERTVSSAIASVLQQTYQDLEIIICNDASTDNTAQVIATITDPRVKVIHNETNLGSGPSRDRAILASTSQWIAFIDADDQWASDRLEKLVEATEGKGLIVFDNLMQCHDSDGQIIPWRPVRGYGAFAAHGQRWVNVSFAQFIVQPRLIMQPLTPREAITRHDIKHSRRPFGQDTEFFLRLITSGLPLRYIPEPLYYYRLTPGSSTTNPKKHELMYEAVRQGLSQGSFDQTEVAAINDKLDQLRRSIEYANFLNAISGKKISVAFRKMLDNPWLAKRLVQRSINSASYELHRAVHFGRGRKG